MKVELQKGEGLSAGERFIVVDGVRWGRTVVSHHGMHGTRHRFEQVGTGALVKDNEREVSVHSERRKNVWVDNRRVPDPAWKPTETAVLEKATDLVARCLLRHPEAVRAEVRRRNEAFRQQQERQEAKKLREFEAKAEEALDRTRGLNLTEQVRIIVELMRWAQVK